MAIVNSDELCRHPTATIHRITCPDCKQATLVALLDLDTTVQCRHCKRRFTLHALRQLRAELGGIEPIRRTLGDAAAEILWEAADRIEAFRKSLRSHVSRDNYE
jgi:hypothetical protein